MHNVYIIFILFLSWIPLYAGLNFGASSMAMGVLISSFLVYISNIKHLKYLLHVKKKFAILIIFFLLYSLITVFVTNNFLNKKAYLSFFGLFFVFGAAYLASYSIANSKNLALYKTIKYIFLIFLLLGLYHIVFVGGPHNIFPFSEASHYALFTGPFSIALYVLSSNIFLKLLITGWLFFASILFPNTTLLTYLLLVFLLHAKLNIKNIILISLGGIILASVIISNSYFHSRIFFWRAQYTKAWSALVYLQGLQDAYYSFVSTNGFGLGFQQLGTQKPSEAGIIIQEIVDNDAGLNRQDGGFTAAKIIAELGYFGLLLLAIYFRNFIKALVYLRYYMKNKRYDLKLAISYSFIYSFLIELFVRGAGYFTQGSFLFYVAISYLFIRRDFETPDNPQ